MYLLEPKGGWGGRSVGLFYRLILSGLKKLSHQIDSDIIDMYSMVRSKPK